MRKLLLGAATLVTSLGLVGGVAGAQTGGSIIENTGPDSNASIRTRVRTDTRIQNRNDFRITNTNTQAAQSGEAEVTDNNRGGSARTGHAVNDNDFRLSATVNNNSADTLEAALDNTPDVDGTSRISDTGPDSDARIRTEVRSSTRVENRNTFDINNTNRQSAQSGDAEVSDNTRGGDAQTGNAENINSTSITLNVTN